MAARADAREKRIANSGVGTDRWISAMAGGDIINGNPVTGSFGDTEDIATVAGSDNEDGPDIRVMVLFGGDDEDAEDPDYTDSASEGRGGSDDGNADREGEGSSKEMGVVLEDEAMETEEEAIETDEEVIETDEEDEGAEADEEDGGDW